MAKTKTPRPSPPPTTAVAGKISFRSRKIQMPKKPPTTTTLATSLTTAATTSPPPPLSLALSAAGEIAAALRHLHASDALLSAIISSTSPPTFSSALPPFHSLAHSILHQQLAPSAAAKIYSRFVSAAGGQITPTSVLALTAGDLRGIGVSGRKAAYLHDLAGKFAAGELSDAGVAAMDDAALLAQLTKVKGIGEWSVHMFMIFSLHRPDVLPAGDLGVRKGVQALYKLKSLPKPAEMAALCEQWRPYRSVGAWYMWRLMESKGAAAKKRNGIASS